MTPNPTKSAALLVGINAYRSAPLRGCVPDIHAMTSLLTTKFGVPSNKIYTLLDGDAIKAQILRGLQWLAAQTADTAYFIYSGHGTRVEDLDGDEARQGSGTTYDQAICPVDYRTRGFILDDELSLHFSTFPFRTRLIVHLDSCYSAKSERGFARDLFDKHIRQRRPRVLPEKYARKAPRGPKPPKSVLPRRNIILLSGCRDFETSADAYLGGQYRGAMTYFVEQAIAKLGPDASYQDVVELARRELEKDGFPQIPQLSGPSGWLAQPIYT